MKKYCVFTLLFLLFSCTTKNAISNNDIIIACQDRVKKDLKDPYSVMWEDSEIILSPDSEEVAKIYLIKQDYNAKNSFWAYAGKTSAYCAIFTNETKWEIISANTTLESIFNASKSGKSLIDITPEEILK